MSTPYKGKTEYGIFFLEKEKEKEKMNMESMEKRNIHATFFMTTH